MMSTDAPSAAPMASHNPRAFFDPALFRIAVLVLDFTVVLLVIFIYAISG